MALLLEQTEAGTLTPQAALAEFSDEGGAMPLRLRLNLLVSRGLRGLFCATPPRCIH